MVLASPESIQITNKDDLLAPFIDGCKPKSAFRIGTEHEKFGFHTADFSPITYDGPNGVEALLKGLQRFGWDPVVEQGKVIALKQLGASVTLEPGGQLELSGAPLETIHQTCSEVNRHLDQVREVTKELGQGFLSLGFSPKWTRDETPVMPKGRYGIMRDYMPKKGGLGLDMMFRSCTVQVNLDFETEQDMVRKMRIGMALQPIATALFANSPFVEGQPNGFQSYRSHIWTDTDPDRCGILPFVLQDGFGFESWVDYALRVPMYFVHRDGNYIDVSGQSFADFMKGELPGLKGELPTMKDWEDHLTTLFPEVRLKGFIEMRGADSGPWGRLCALPALWVGLLYDDKSLDAAEALIEGWSVDAVSAMRDDVPIKGLHTKGPDGRNMREIARDVVAIAQQGLAARGYTDGLGNDETMFLRPLNEILDSGKSASDLLLDQYHNEWNGDINCVFRDHAY